MTASPGRITRSVPQSPVKGSADTGWPVSKAIGVPPQLSNPVAALISVPFQLNYDQDIGPADDGDRWLLNVQPVVPVDLNEDWNLISRTILPIISQSDVVPGQDAQFGLGNTVQSLFFSPKALTASGWTWGVGPVFQLPTDTNGLGNKNWGLGASFVVLKLEKGNPWVYGALVGFFGVPR